MSGKVVATVKRKNRRKTPKRDKSAQNSAKKSLVRVFFSSRNLNLTYYNDRFDLREGDFVYVSGKLDGLMGVVTEVLYCFKIRLSDYERVTALVDTKVKGEFYNVGADFLTFDPSALPYQKVLSWLRPPEKETAEYAYGCESRSFPLDDLSGMKLSAEDIEKAKFCLEDGRVKYLSVRGTYGRALVVGKQLYEIEFRLHDGIITNLFCSCYETGCCGHGAAAMLKLRQVLACIEESFADEYRKSGCFCVTDKNMLLRFSVGAKTNGKIVF